MARSLSLARGRVPALGSDRVGALPTRHPTLTLRGAIAAVRETLAPIAAAGRVGAAVEAGRKPNIRDLSIASLAEADVLRRPYRL